MSQKFDTVVVGAGPGGYVCAIRAAQLGQKVAIIEREYYGGVCLNVGCIPSKAMISAAKFLDQVQNQSEAMGFTIGSVKLDMGQLKSWKDSVSKKMANGVEQLLKGNKVTMIMGKAHFESDQILKVKTSSGEESIEAKNFVVATGSRPLSIPGFDFDEKNILSSTGALDLEKVPKKILVVGGGYIGLEIGSYLAKLGTEVEILEAGDTLLSGICEPDVVQVIERKLKKKAIKLHYKAFAKGYVKSGKNITVTADVKGSSQEFTADKVIVTVGRKPNSDEMNLSAAGVEVNPLGFVKVDKQMRTSKSNIFAIGDIAGQPMLAHKASHEGVLVAEVLSGQNRVFDAKTVPAVIFTDPEVASVGLTEKQCVEAGYENISVGKFPFGANGKAVSLQQTEGFVKILADSESHVVLGVHIVGPQASNLISEAALAVEMGARLEDLALTIHPHPTLGETMMEAAEAALGHAVHIIQKPLSHKKKLQPQPAEL